jgi:hypothetical protein
MFVCLERAMRINIVRAGCLTPRAATPHEAATERIAIAVGCDDGN